MSGLHRHVLPLGFMNLTVEFHDCRRFRHIARTGRKRGLAVLRLDFFLEPQMMADFTVFSIGFPLNGQTALGGKVLPRLLHPLFRLFCAAHSFLIFFLLA